LCQQRFLRFGHRNSHPVGRGPRLTATDLATDTVTDALNNFRTRALAGRPRGRTVTRGPLGPRRTLQLVKPSLRRAVLARGCTRPEVCEIVGDGLTVRALAGSCTAFVDSCSPKGGLT
jgi:hypothetical protein